MSEVEKQESQKTVVAFIAGLIIGGLLVWVFGGNDRDQNEEVEEENEVVEEMIDLDTVEENDDVVDTSTASNVEMTLVEDVQVMETGEAELDVDNQPAGSSVVISSATFPNDEGWIGVRDYVDNEPVGLLGVARYSKEQGLIPTEVELLRATEAGETYAVVFYTESGNREFDLREDFVIEGTVETFRAQ